MRRNRYMGGVLDEEHETSQGPPGYTDGERPADECVFSLRNR